LSKRLDHTDGKSQLLSSHCMYSMQRTDFIKMVQSQLKLKLEAVDLMQHCHHNGCNCNVRCG